MLIDQALEASHLYHMTAIEFFLPVTIVIIPYHKALLIMFGCDGISDHASWNEVFHYWDTKLS